MDSLKVLMTRQTNANEVEELCRRMGASFVIAAARAFVERKERAAAEEHARWRDEMIKATERAGGEKQG